MIFKDEKYKPDMWRPQNKSWHKNKSLTKKILFSEIAVFSWDIFNKNNKLKLVPFNDLCEEITATCSQLLFLWIQINMIFSFILLFFATQCTNKNQGFFCFFLSMFYQVFWTWWISWIGYISLMSHQQQVQAIGQTCLFL